MNVNNGWNVFVVAVSLCTTSLQHAYMLTYHAVVVGV